MSTVSTDQLTFVGSSLFVDGVKEEVGTYVTGFPGSSYTASSDNTDEEYMRLGGDSWYVAGYSSSTIYITRLSFYTDVAISAFNLTITAGYSYSKNGIAVISTNADYGSKLKDEFDKLASIPIGFTKSYEQATLAFENLEIPANTTFYVYLGPGKNDISYSTIYARTSTNSNAVFNYSATGSTSYTVTYDGNGASGGVMASQTKPHGQDIVLSENGFTVPEGTSTPIIITLKKNDGTDNNADIKTATNTTPKIFNKWNTAADGSGVSYNAGAIYSDDSNVTMYAQWVDGTIEKEAIVLGTTSREGIPSSPIVLTASLYDEITLSYSLTKSTDYIFNSWNTEADGTGTEYDPITQHSFTSDITLYAIYTPTTSNPIVTLPSDITRDGYIFKGWSTNAIGSPLISGNTYVPTETQTIYAVWEKGATEAEGMYIYTGNKWHKVASFVK